jgi:membrane-associated PAP2 superfamily phosphatase
VYGAGLYALHGGLPFDIPVQNWFFTSPCHLPEPRDCWLISKADENLTFWFHGVPRFLAWSVAGIVAVILGLGYCLPAWRPHRQACIIFLLGLGITAAMVAIMKQFTGHYCPGQLMRYGGVIVDKILEHPAPRCFPAGHPSAGMGMLVICFAPVSKNWVSKNWRRLGWLGGIGFGGFLGIVQLARGEHFLSHILATLLTAIFVGLVMRGVVMRKNTRL